MLIKHTFADRSPVHLRVTSGSFSSSLYEEYAREAIKHGALIVRVIDDKGTVLYKRTGIDA